jgi:hypothetical protein
MATIAVGTGLTTFSTGRVISRTFSVIGRNMVTFVVLGLLVVVPLNIYAWFFLHSVGGASPFAIYTRQLLPFIIGSFVLQTALHYLLQGALVHGTIVDLNGRRAAFGECLSTALRSLFPLIVIAFLATIAIYVGLILLVFPGLILATMWFVVVPVRVVESTGIIRSFSRSSELTRGHRGAIFGLLIIYVIGAAVVGLSIRPLTGMELVSRTLPVPNLAYSVAAIIVGVILAVISATGIASVYYELRTIKEGVGPEQLASVFA